MEPHIGRSPGSNTLAQLGDVILSQEGILGRFLGAMASDSETNLLSFAGANSAADLPRVGERTKLEFTDGHPAAKAGAVLVWFGTVLVDAQPRRVAAYRPA